MLYKMRRRIIPRARFTGSPLYGGVRLEAKASNIEAGANKCAYPVRASVGK